MTATAARAARDLSAARLDEQRRETRAARELLAATAAEAEAVHYERRARGAQWRGSLLALQRRDEALKARRALPLMPTGVSCSHMLVSHFRPQHSSSRRFEGMQGNFCSSRCQALAPTQLLLPLTRCSTAAVKAGHAV